MFSVQTGMLTSFCAIASLIAVRLFVLARTQTMILILIYADIGLTQHFHLHLLLFPAGPMYVRTGRVGRS